MATRILIVEDEAIVAAVLQDSLSRLGYEVPETFPSGEEALERIPELKPDLVLMDIVLQGRMNGIEAAAEVRRRHGLPVVFLTSHADEATFERAKLTEPFGYVLKPFQDREVQINIEISLYKYRMEQEREHLRHELEEALAHIKTLKGLLPICAWCKQIRDDQGYWKEVEVYIVENTAARITHGMCPKCAREFAESMPVAPEAPAGT
jgi:CheY-like chemotaxis protein